MRTTRAFTAFSALLLVALTGCNLLRGHETVPEYIDDTALTAQVKAALAQDETVPATAVNVDVFNGVVTLTGVVDSEQQRDRAVEIAKKVPGVKDVKSALHVGSEGKSEGAS